MMIMISPLSTSTVAVSIQSAAAKVLEPKKESSILRSSAGVSIPVPPRCAAPAAIRPVTISTNPFRKTQLHGASSRSCRAPTPPPPPRLALQSQWNGACFLRWWKEARGIGNLVLQHTENRLSNFSSVSVPWSHQATGRPTIRPSVRPSVRFSDRPFLLVSSLSLFLLAGTVKVWVPPRGLTPPLFPSLSLLSSWHAFRTQSQLYLLLLHTEFEAEAAASYLPRLGEWVQYRQQRRTGTTASLAQKNYDRHLAPELSAWSSAATGLKNSAYQTAQRVKNGFKAKHHMMHSV